MSRYPSKGCQLLLLIGRATISSLSTWSFPVSTEMVQFQSPTKNIPALHGKSKRRTAKRRFQKRFPRARSLWISSEWSGCMLQWRYSFRWKLQSLTIFCQSWTINKLIWGYIWLKRRRTQVPLQLTVDYDVPTNQITRLGRLEKFGYHLYRLQGFSVYWTDFTIKATGFKLDPIKNAHAGSPCQWYWLFVAWLSD